MERVENYNIHSQSCFFLFLLYLEAEKQVICIAIVFQSVSADKVNNFARNGNGFAYGLDFSGKWTPVAQVRHRRHQDPLKENLEITNPSNPSI